jgi:hypothetical protein
LCVSFYTDAKISQLFPSWIVNFILRTVIATAVRVLLGVAEGIRAGKRQDHILAISNKRDEIYDWVDERANVMFWVMKQKKMN